MSSARNRSVLAAIILAPVAMLGLTYASVPLYRVFCAATGYNGTPRRVADGPETAVANAKVVTVRFDANKAKSLDWNFYPVERKVKVKLGEQKMALFRARNLSDHTITGSAIFNVTPPQAGAYFNKIQCFCFTEQTLKPGESADMPVVFYVDPGLATDPDSRTVGEITLSYTFYPVDKPKTADNNNAAGAAATN